MPQAVWLEGGRARTFRRRERRESGDTARAAPPEEERRVRREQGCNVDVIGVVVTTVCGDNGCSVTAVIVL